MRLIVGAARSGKYAYLLSLGFAPADIADGGADGLETLFARPVVYRLHALVRRLMEAGEEPSDYILPRLRQDAVVVCDEVGCGVVPTDPFARAWRDEVGRLCQALAARSDTVERLCCGIAQRLK
jgi:adenosyl cobinamide kinase/adenosyl cobinamide phosphate guanylyltransferase